MRSFLMLLALVSFPALACPNLAGNYKTCQSSANSGSTTRQISIAQKLVGGFHQLTFTMKEAEGEEETVEKYLADGKTKTTTETDADSGITIKTITSASCNSSALTIKMKALIDSEEFANLVIETKKDGQQLTQVYSGTSMGEVVNETIVCQ